MDFSPVERMSAADQVASSLRDAIVSGDLESGEGLPSERSLAQSFAVNRGTIREALRRLEAWGLVHIRQGGRTTVRDVLSSAGLHVLPFLIAPGGQPDPRMIRDLLQMRVMILSWTGRWVAMRRPGAEALQPLRELVEELDTQPARRQELDFAFFERLVALADNRILSMLTALIREVYLQQGAVFAPLYARDFNTALHRRAIEAIAGGHAEEAAAALRSYAEGILQEVTP